MINDPELIILDEPTAGLDPRKTEKVKKLILRWRDQGKTILMCSHQLADVQDVCDRIAILNEGQLREMGRVDSILKISDETEIRATRLTDEATGEIKAVIERHGGRLLDVGNPTSTLRELFERVIEESEAHPGRRPRKVE
jgi:ABC-2 type transport system ATP-binding protein